MLKIARNPEFTHEVSVRVPVDGGFAEQKFRARFRMVPWNDLCAIENDPEAQAKMVLVGWDGIVDDEEKPIPYSDAMRDQLLGMLFMRASILRVYVDAVAGAKRGN